MAQLHPDDTARETPWQRMDRYERFRLFGVETPRWLDYIALIALVGAVDGAPEMAGWTEWIFTLALWAAAVVTTTYYRAKAELAAEAMAELHALLTQPPAPHRTGIVSDRSSVSPELPGPRTPGRANRGA